jgi:hypothetical protein
MDFAFITDDWKKIPQTTKYVFAFGAFLIFIVWLVDHWGGNIIYTLFGWDFRHFFFEFGVVVIILAFVPLIYTQWVYWKRALRYRMKYPLSELNKTFYLVWFKGKLHLFDIPENKYYHVTPWETAQDLFFINVGIRFDYDLKDAPSTIKLDEKNSIQMSSYANGGVINTRLR